MRHYSSPLGFVGCALLLLSVDHCSSSSSSGKPGTPASGVIGTSGGTVESTDGVISVKIPAGAVSGDVTVTVTPESAPPAGAVGAVYDIGPSGTVFNSPVTMTFHYALASLGGAAPSSLRAATYGANTWQILAGGSVDTNAQTVSGTTMHLSPYGEIVVSSGDVCVQVAELGCAATSGSLAPGSGTGTVTGSGGAPTSCTEPTCATATNVCAGYPGATMAGCTDGATGFTASCCFPPSAPICFGVAGSAGCASSGTSQGGTPAPTTCPQSTCADAVNPCGGYPGATFGGCTDSGSGWAGSCCFAPGTPVCVTDNASVGCVEGPATTGVGGNGGGGSPGGGTGGCPAPPTCATATACGDVTGSTAQSCTDTASGFNATCCLPAGVLPSPFSGGGGGGSSGTGGSIGGGGPPASDAGTSISYPPDSGSYPPPPFDAGDPQMQFDAGLPSQPDASTCQYKVNPLGGGMCSVQGVCASTGIMYQVTCNVGDAALASCTCTQNGTTTGTAALDCTKIQESDITMCGYPD